MGTGYLLHVVTHLGTSLQDTGAIDPQIMRAIIGANVVKQQSKTNWQPLHGSAIGIAESPEHFDPELIKNFFEYLLKEK